MSERQKIESLMACLDQLVELLRQDPVCQWTAHFEQCQSEARPLFSSNPTFEDLRTFSRKLLAVYAGEGSFNSYKLPDWYNATSQNPDVTNQTRLEEMSSRLFELAYPLSLRIISCSELPHILPTGPEPLPPSTWWVDTSRSTDTGGLIFYVEADASVSFFWRVGGGGFLLYPPPLDQPHPTKLQVEMSSSGSRRKEIVDRVMAFFCVWKGPFERIEIDSVEITAFIGGKMNTENNASNPD